MVPHTKPYRILVVEDDPDHVDLIRVLFDRHDPNARINVTRSAEEAIACLQGPRADMDFGKNGLPDVIVLDISMPGMGGLGFLEWYGDHDHLSGVPVVVFTSSEDPALAAECFSLGAREFTQKPLDFPQLVTVVRRVMDHWRPERQQSLA